LDDLEEDEWDFEELDVVEDEPEVDVDDVEEL
jgi:hypothetical protein